MNFHLLFALVGLFALSSALDDGTEQGIRELRRRSEHCVFCFAAGCSDTVSVSPITEVCDFFKCDTLDCPRSDQRILRELCKTCEPCSDAAFAADNPGICTYCGTFTCPDPSETSGKSLGKSLKKILLARKICNAYEDDEAAHDECKKCFRCYRCVQADSSTGRCEKCASVVDETVDCSTYYDQIAD